MPKQPKVPISQKQYKKRKCVKTKNTKKENSEKKKKSVLPNLPNVGLVQTKITLVQSDVIVKLSEKKDKGKYECYKNICESNKIITLCQHTKFRKCININAVNNREECTEQFCNIVLFENKGWNKMISLCKHSDKQPKSTQHHRIH